MATSVALSGHECAPGDDAAYPVLSQAIGHHFLSPQNHVDGQDGPNDADQDEVAATIFAVEAAIHGLIGFAVLAAVRATDAIDNRWFGVDPGRLVREAADEVARQRADLALLRRAAADRQVWRAGAPAEVVTLLRG